MFSDLASSIHAFELVFTLAFHYSWESDPHSQFTETTLTGKQLYPPPNGQTPSVTSPFSFSS